MSKVEWIVGGCILAFFIAYVVQVSYDAGSHAGQNEIRARIAQGIVESHRQHDQMCRDYLSPSKQNNAELVPDCAPEVRDLLDDQVMWDSSVAATTHIQ